MNISIVYARDEAGRLALLYLGDDAETARQLMDNLEPALAKAGMREGVVKVEMLRRPPSYKRREVALGLAAEAQASHAALRNQQQAAHEARKREYRERIDEARASYEAAIRSAESHRAAPEKAAAAESAALAAKVSTEKQSKRQPAGDSPAPPGGKPASTPKK